MNKHELLKSLLAVVLAITVGTTFIPLLGSTAYAEGEGDAPATVSLDADTGEDADVVIDTADPTGGEEDESTIDVTPDESTGADENDNPVDSPVNGEEAVSEGDTATDETGADGLPETILPAGSKLTGTVTEMSASEIDAYHAALEGENIRTMAGYFTLTTRQAGNRLYFTGKTVNSNYQFTYISVDRNLKMELIEGVTSFDDQYLDLTEYGGTGYHTVAVGITPRMSAPTLNDVVDVYEKKFVPVNTITARPNYSGRFYYVYSKYFEYYPFKIGGNISGTNMYMEYKLPKAKTWKRTGAMKANAIKLYTEQGYRIKGIKANKKYQTRLRYGAYVTYSTDIGGNGKTYFFGGPVLNTKTIKSGAAKKPAIKSVKVKATKVKRHKVKHYGYYTGVYLYTEKFYTYKVKVTVKLKKKPGTAGLWINGKFVKGNKKKYTVTLPGSSYSTKKPKGKKFKVGICSYQGKSFGGLSPLYQKTYKIK